MAKKTIFKRRRKQLPQQELRGRTAMPTIPDDARSLSASTDPMAMLNTQASQMSASMQGLPSGERLTNANVDNEIIDRHRSGDMTDIASFNEAFGTAHKMGLKEFFWRTKQGKVGRYAVKFADASSTSGSPSAGRNQSSTKGSILGRDMPPSTAMNAPGDISSPRQYPTPDPVRAQHSDTRVVGSPAPEWGSEGRIVPRTIKDDDWEAYVALWKKLGKPDWQTTDEANRLMPRKSTKNKKVYSDELSDELSYATKRSMGLM